MSIVWPTLLAPTAIGATFFVAALTRSPPVAAHCDVWTDISRTSRGPRVASPVAPCQTWQVGPVAHAAQRASMSPGFASNVHKVSAPRNRANSAWLGEFQQLIRADQSTLGEPACACQRREVGQFVQPCHQVDQLVALVRCEHGP